MVESHRPMGRKPVRRKERVALKVIRRPLAPASHPAEAAAGVLDEVAKDIITQLQEDGRRSYSAIGRAVGLSEAAVRQRVRSLFDSHFIQIVAVTDPLRLG